MNSGISSQKRKIQTSKIRVLRRIAEDTHKGHIPNTRIRGELGIFDLKIKDRVLEQWLRHLHQIPDINYLKSMVGLPGGKRNIGRPRKRCSDQNNGTETSQSKS